MDHDTRESLRVGIAMLIGDLPWRLMNPGDSVKDRGEQYRRQEVVTQALLKLLERYEIKAPPRNEFPGYGPSTAFMRSLKRDDP